MAPKPIWICVLGPFSWRMNCSSSAASLQLPVPAASEDPAPLPRASFPCIICLFVLGRPLQLSIQSWSTKLTNRVVIHISLKHGSLPQQAHMEFWLQDGFVTAQQISHARSIWHFASWCAKGRLVPQVCVLICMSMRPQAGAAAQRRMCPPGLQPGRGTVAMRRRRAGQLTFRAHSSTSHPSAPCICFHDASRQLEVTFSACRTVESTFPVCSHIGCTQCVLHLCFSGT